MIKTSFVDPVSFDTLVQVSESLLNERTQKVVAQIVNGIPRFVKPEENYAESFGWQWKKWADNQSEARGSNIKQRELILARTHFSEYPIEGKRILECGMGGGDDTEVLVGLPFAEIHSFDMSTAVERAYEHLKDDRLFISQASIYGIPYPFL